jgi:hypothetical protein
LVIFVYDLYYDAWIHKHQVLFTCLVGWLAGWLFGCLVVWLFGCLIVWLFGCLVD